MPCDASAHAKNDGSSSIEKSVSYHRWSWYDLTISNIMIINDSFNSMPLDRQRGLVKKIKKSVTKQF